MPTNAPKITTRQISSKFDADRFLDLYKTHLGLSVCDTFGDRKARALDLPAAAAMVEKLTGLSISENVYGLRGNACPCEIRLPHAPIQEVLCFEWFNGFKWGLVDPDSYELVLSFNTRGRNVLRLKRNHWWPWCNCGCIYPKCSCECEYEVWRIRYATGCAKQFELGGDPLLMRAVLYAAEYLDTRDETIHDTLKLLIGLVKPRMVAGC